ncbi:MAG: lipocalin-like domain-containing protein [Desulfobacteraceae bacterium]|jgi:hypothetical protein
MTSIIGTWGLCSIELKHESGNTVYPYGRNVKGLVLYQEDGYMAGIISGDDRPPVSSPTLIGIANHERAAIARHFNAYAGRYQVEEKRIIHNIKVSFVPNLMSGSAHVSNYTLVGDTLTLKSTIPSVMQEPNKSIIITWERLKSTRNQEKNIT